MAHVIQLGFVHKRSGIAGKNIHIFTRRKMAVSFENNYVMLSKEHARHINERHVDLDREHRASKFLRGFNLTSTLALLTRKTFQDSDDYDIVEEGYKRSHGYFYIYVFKMKKVIGVCPWGYPTDEICIYFSWKKEYGEKFKIISAYPFSRAYYAFLRHRKTGVAPY